MRILLMMIAALIFGSAAAAQDFALDAPGTVGMRDTFGVGWTAPQPKGGVIEIRPIGENARRVAYSYTGKNPTLVEAPEEPGNYVLVLTFEGEDRVSQPLIVEMATATLDAVATADAGADIVVTWTGPDNRNDHITFAAPGGDAIRGASYAYVGISKDGTVTIQVPQDAAGYDLVYQTGETILARLPISVGGVAATLDAPTEVPAGGRLVVGFDGPDNRGDRITFAVRDGDPLSPASYAYVRLAQDDRVSLRALEEIGGYDIVYLTAGRIIGRRPVEIVPVTMELDAALEVQALLVFEITWRGHGNAGDRINLVVPGGNENIVYNYVDPVTGSVSMGAPKTAGSYELVYVTRGGKELARRPIIVTPPAIDPGQIEVVFAPGSGFGPGDAIGVILDASGSMLQRQGGERRIEIAKRVLSDLVVDTIPAGTGFALRVFGNREADACRTDLEIGLAPHDPNKALSVISGIKAINLAKTPIAQSVSLAASDLAAAEGAKVLILVTDGEETCEGDPAQAIEGLRALGWDLRVNIVGYAIDDADLARTFQSWAAAGGGVYFDAAGADELSVALARAAAAPFEIITSKGALIGKGLAGDLPLTIPAGEYVVRIGGRELPVVVEPRKLSRITP